MAAKDRTANDDKPPSLLRVIASNRAVPPLTQAEVLALRKMLVDFEAIKASCPIAKRALSER